MRTATTLLMLALLVGCRREVDIYPPEVIRNFMTSCTERADRRTCRCAIDTLQRRYSLEAFRGFEDRMRKGETPKELIDSVADCRG